MGSGARLAQERDGWAAEWRTADLDQEGEHLLGILESAEELRAAVPGVRVALVDGATQRDEGDGAGGTARRLIAARRHRPVLIAVTDRRILVVGREDGGVGLVTSTTARFEQARGDMRTGLALLDHDDVLELDLAARDRLADLLGDQGANDRRR